MKKILFLASLSSLGFSAAQAQINKGAALFGGNASYNQSTYETTSTGPRVPAGSSQTETTDRSFGFNPNAGLFVADNLALGLTLGVNDRKTTSPYYPGPNTDVYEQSNRMTSFSAAPFLRYYYLPVENFGFYGQVSAGYSYQRNKSEGTASNMLTHTSKGHGGFASITPALVYFPIHKLSLELTAGGINYSRYTTKTEESPTTSDRTKNEFTSSGFGANFGLSYLTLGASYYIGRQ